MPRPHEDVAAVLQHRVHRHHEKAGERPTAIIRMIARASECTKIMPIARRIP